jgi:DNA-binding HxlR family transcriptional regulator
MVFQLDEVLARDDRPAAGEFCPIDRALDVLGTRSAMLILREAFYGTTRFDDFAARVGITPAVASARLRELVEAGLLMKEPYRLEGQRTRSAYLLTEAGREVAPAIVALASWGAANRPRAGTPGYLHAGCGATVTARLCCSEGHEVAADDVEVVASET